MTEQEAKTLANELECNRYWFVTDVRHSPITHEWTVELKHRVAPRIHYQAFLSPTHETIAGITSFGRLHARTWITS